MKPLDNALELVDAHIKAGNTAAAARILSALTRACMTNAAKAALVAKAAQVPAIKNHPDYIV